MKVKITRDEIGPAPEVDALILPKYVSYIINRANRWSQGTRPKVVGQLTELFKDFPGNTLNEWEEWYLQQKPNAISQATEKILKMVENIKDATDKIDRPMVETWTKNLVIVETFKGLRFQKAVLKKGAEILNADYRIATKEEEPKGIDGYIDNKPVSIKPATYRLEPEIVESLSGVVLYYLELEDGIEVDYSELLK